MTNLFLATEKALAIIRWRNGIWDMDLQLVEKQPVCLALDPWHLASVLATNEAEPGVFYAASNKGIFHSVAGILWEELPVPDLADMQLGRAHALVVSHLH